MTFLDPVTGLAISVWRDGDRFVARVWPLPRCVAESASLEGALRGVRIALAEILEKDEAAREALSFTPRELRHVVSALRRPPLPLGGADHEQARECYHGSRSTQP